jgi:hypothetical protein
VTILCPLKSRRHRRLRWRAVPDKASTGARDEITRQQALDVPWGKYQDTLEARVAAVSGARRAFSERQVGADWALRQSLIDLASVCELLADELPPHTA